MQSSQLTSLSERRELRNAEIDWRNTVRARVNATKARQQRLQQEPPRARVRFIVGLIAACLLAIVTADARAHDHGGNDVIEVVSGNTVYLLEQCKTTLSSDSIPLLNAECESTVSWPNTDSSIQDWPEIHFDAVSDDNFSLKTGCLAISYLNEPDESHTYFMNCNDPIFADGFEKGECSHG